MNKEINFNTISDYVYEKTGQRYNYIGDIAKLLKYFSSKLGWQSQCLYTIKDYFEFLESGNDKDRLQELFGVRWVEDDGPLICLANAMYVAGFIEYDFYISQAWLTEEGQMFYWLLVETDEWVWHGDIILPIEGWKEDEE